SQHNEALETNRIFSEIDVTALPRSFGQQVQRHTANLIQGGFSLDTGPVWRAIAIRRNGLNPERLLLVGHHLVVDAASWGIITEDLEQLLTQGAGKGTPILPSKTTSFRQWATRTGSLPEAPAQCDPPPVSNLEGDRAVISLMLTEEDTRGFGTVPEEILL